MLWRCFKLLFKIFRIIKDKSCILYRKKKRSHQKNVKPLFTS